jgi:osmotically-inducible protein OsmY
MRGSQPISWGIAQHRNLGPPNQICVDTRDHVVYLSGAVTTSWMLYNAEDIARQVLA